MCIEEIKEAISAHDIEKLLSLTKRIEPEDVDEAVKLYEKFYEAELSIAKIIQDILAHVKSRRSKMKIPFLGNYTYKLEK
jgi:hypothetical protein